MGFNGRPSRGCGLCQKRKLKCDETRPNCKRCEKAGRTCPGYTTDGDFFWHDCNEITESKVLRNSKAPKRKQGAGPWTAPVQTESNSQKSTAPTKSYQQMITPITRRPTPSLSIGLNAPPDHRSLAAFFLRDIGVPEIAVPYCSWMSVLTDHKPPLDALGLAISSLTIGHVGRTEDNDNLIRTGNVYYSQALQRLHKRLLLPTVNIDADLIIACSILGLHELFNGMTQFGTGWRSHIDGAVALLRKCGPEWCSQPIPHAIFLDIRVHAINKSLGYRTTTFLAEPDWLEIPWRYRTKDEFQCLVDIMAQLCNVLVLVDSVQEEQDRARQGDLRTEAKAACVNIITTLDRWHEAYKIIHPTAAYWIRPSRGENKVDREGRGKVFTTAFDFDCPPQAQTLGWYWSSRLIVQEATEQFADVPSHTTTTTTTTAPPTKLPDLHMHPLIPPPPQTSGPDQAPAPGASTWKDFDASIASCTSMARSIAQTTEYFLRPENRAMGAVIHLWPLHLASQWYKRGSAHDREHRWCAECLAVLNSPKGPVTTARYVSRPGSPQSMGSGLRGVGFVEDDSYDQRTLLPFGQGFYPF